MRALKLTYADYETDEGMFQPILEIGVDAEVYSVVISNGKLHVACSHDQGPKGMVEIEIVPLLREAIKLLNHKNKKAA